jgi:YHS domain-containing protein
MEMDFLVYVLLWGGVFLLLQRFGYRGQVGGIGRGQPCESSQGPERSPKQLGWTAPKAAVDPVCGQAVQTNSARSSVDDGAVHYFCSRECRERFEAAPKLYFAQPPQAMSAETSQDPR